MERPRGNESCGCHIGYVHLDRLRLHEVFAGGVLERIPAQPLWRGATSPAGGEPTGT